MAVEQVSMEDLLRREPLEVDMSSIGRWINGKTIMITGSAGSIGTELSHQLLSSFSPQRLLLVDRSENGQFFLSRELSKQYAHKDSNTEVDVLLADVLDRTRMKTIMKNSTPDIIFHAAAYKHVPLMEAHPGEAVKNIVLATRQLADLARDCGVETFVLISSDKAVNPTSVMGTCKRVAELYLQAQAGDSRCCFVAVRFGNVLDSAGSVVQIFRQQIQEGGPITVTHPQMERFFMTIPEAARLVIQAGALGQDGDILTLDMGEPLRIVDLANDMIRLSGLEVGKDVQIEYIGLRPGEKLHEELQNHNENHVPTLHPKITALQQQNHTDAEVAIALIDLLEQVIDDRPERIISLLKQIVPEYNANHDTPGSYQEQHEPN